MTTINDRRPWELQQERHELTKQMRAMLDKARDEKRGLTAEEDKQFRLLKTKSEDLAFAIREAEEADADRLGLAARDYNARAGLQEGRKVAEGMGEAIRQVTRQGGTADVKVSPRALFRAMTPDSGSMGNSAYTATQPEILQQAIPGRMWMERLSTFSDVRNGTTVPYLDRDNRSTPAAKAYTASASASDFVVSANTVAFKNYHVYMQVHNNVIRDGAAPNLDQLLVQWAAADLMKKVGLDALIGTGGSDDLTGIQNYSGVLTQALGTNSFDWDQIAIAVSTLLEKSADVGAKGSRLSIVCHPDAWWQICCFAGTDGHYKIRPEELANIQVFTDPGISITEGTDNDQTRLFIGDLSQFHLYWDGLFTVAAANGPSMAKDYSDILVTMRVDLKSHQPDHVIMLTGVPADPTAGI